MKIAVIGGTRFIGVQVVRMLVDLGHTVVCVHRGRTHAAENRAACLHVDRKDRPAFARVMRELDAEVVVDLFAFDDDSEQLLEVLPTTVRRVVHASSIDAYFDPPDAEARPVPIRETDSVRTERWKEFENLSCEAALLRAAEAGRVETAILRLPAVYGPGDYQFREWYFIRRALDGRAHVALPDGGWHLLHRGYVEDVARGIVVAALAPRVRERIYHLGHERAWTVRGIAEGVARAVGHTWKLVDVPAAALPFGTPFQAHRPIVVDTRAFREEFGSRELVSPEEGMARTVAWFREHPPLPGALEVFRSRYGEVFDYAAEDRAISAAVTGTTGRPPADGWIIRAVEDTDQPEVRRMLVEAWGSVGIESLDRSHVADDLPGFLAHRAGRAVGLATFEVRDAACELVTLQSAEPGKGIGGGLLAAVEGAAIRAGCRRIWLVATNDHLDAVRFYQRRGYRVCAIHRDAAHRARVRKPSLPRRGIGGVPIEDYLEMEKPLAGDVDDGANGAGRKC